ncbi:MAG: rhodanese-like domain-containing protein [Bacteroidaceae bacterium]|nr:rhodanese-like domain-containing protein [Bacteroidaceae bacterium]
MIKTIYMIFFVCTFSLGLWACTSKQKVEYKNLTSAQFEELIKSPNVQLVDVRTLAEHMEGHIPGSLNINVKDEEGFPTAVDELLDKGREVAVYCRSGRRSRTAAELLVKKGFKVYNLDKGILNWIEEGREIEK